MLVIVLLHFSTPWLNSWLSGAMAWSTWLLHQIVCCILCIVLRLCFIVAFCYLFLHYVIYSCMMCVLLLHFLVYQPGLGGRIEGHVRTCKKRLKSQLQSHSFLVIPAHVEKCISPDYWCLQVARLPERKGYLTSWNKLTSLEANKLASSKLR